MARQEQRFGEMKAGASFFGLLTATGLSVLLIALFSAIVVGLGFASNAKVSQANEEVQAGTETAKTIGLVGAIVLLVILLVSYYCGYVAGRMARFDGLRQGLAVWLWGIIAVAAIAAIIAIAGSGYNLYAQLPRLPVKEGNIPAAAWIAVAVALVAALVSALVGGLAGMRFHRKVDEAGFDARADAAPVR